MTVPKRFGVLRFFGTLLKVIAWIVLVVSVLGAILAVIFGSSPVMTGLLEQSLPAGTDASVLTGAGIGGGIVIGLLLLIFGLIYFLMLYVAGESIHLQLAVEENTRLTAALLLRMHQEGQVDSATGYGAGGATGGGFSTESY
jgi:hypothetical protein